MTGRRYGGAGTNCAAASCCDGKEKELGARRDVEDVPVPTITLTKHS